VTKNFNEVVNNRSLDVLVQFYVPGNEKFQRFKMRYERLARSFKDDLNLQVCKIDMSLNELKGMRFEDYPVFIFYPNNNKKGVRFEEEPDEEKLKEFLGKHVRSYAKKSDL
jgi:hypothetical protein